jgi:hypothetical protein
VTSTTPTTSTTKRRRGPAKRHGRARGGRKERVDPTATSAVTVDAPTKRHRGERGRQRSSLPAYASKEIVRSFYTTVGRDVWMSALESLPSGSPGGKLFALMHDRSYDSASIERLCAEAGIDIPGLVRLFTDYKVGEAIVEAAEHSKAVIGGMAIDASPSTKMCRTCVGFRRVRVAHPLTGEPVEIDCFDCNGTGETRTPGDPRKLETFLKVMHAVGDDERGSLVMLNQQFNFGAQHSSGVMRGQELLAAGRRARTAPPNEPNQGESSENSRPAPPSSATITVEPLTSSGK